jgi:hypothetical protein
MVAIIPKCMYNLMRHTADPRFGCRFLGRKKGTVTLKRRGMMRR